jgi:uncharacterized coiled-coil protein SlyX
LFNRLIFSSSIITFYFSDSRSTNIGKRTRFFTRTFTSKIISNFSFLNLQIFLQIATDTGLNERARYEQRIEDLEIDLRKVGFVFVSIQFISILFKQLDNDREEIIQQNHLLREQIKALENKLDEQSFTISQLNQEITDQKNASAQLRYLSEEAERLVEENQAQLNLKKDEVRTQEDKIIRLEKKICMSEQNLN